MWGRTGVVEVCPKWGAAWALGYMPSLGASEACPCWDLCDITALPRCGLNVQRTACNGPPSVYLCLELVCQPEPIALGILVCAGVGVPELCERPLGERLDRLAGAWGEGLWEGATAAL